MSTPASAPSTPYCVAMVTINTEENAKKLANALLTAKLCACVNMIPKVTSMYWWQVSIL